MSGRMRAQVFHGPGDLRFEELPAPNPAAGEVVLRIDAALTCGTDVKVLRRGHPVMLPVVPTVFGHELAGTVAAVGAGVRAWREGDRAVAANSAPCGACPPCRAERPNLCEDLLFVNGAYGERIALPPRVVEKNLVAIRPATAARHAAFAEPLACAIQGIRRGGVAAGMTVAIFGHGPLGALLALVARERGARAILVGKAGWRLDRLRAAGFAECIDARAVEDVTAELRARTGGRGAEVTVDATGRPEVWEGAIDAVARGGTVVFFGGCAPGTQVRVDTRRAHYDELALVGAFHHTPELIRAAVALVESGTVPVETLVTHAMGLADVPRALRLMADGRALKVAIDPSI